MDVAAYSCSLSNLMQEVEKKVDPSCQGKDAHNRLSHYSAPPLLLNKRNRIEFFELRKKVGWLRWYSFLPCPYFVRQTDCEVQTDSTKYAIFSPSKCCGALWKIFLTVLCCEFCVKQRRRGADDQQIKTNKFSSSFKVQIETGFRCSSKKNSKNLLR